MCGRAAGGTAHDARGPHAFGSASTSTLSFGFYTKIIDTGEASMQR